MEMVQNQSLISFCKKVYIEFEQGETQSIKDLRKLNSDYVL